MKNKLSLNLCKTIIMRFGNSEPNTQLIVKTEGVKIERVHEIPFLGVIIDDELIENHTSIVYKLTSQEPLQ